jgi:hypothetical protein
MFHLNPNAITFRPSGQSFGPIIESNEKLTPIIPGSDILQKDLKTKTPTTPNTSYKIKTHNTPNSINSINSINSNDFVTKLIDEKHILISKISELENIIHIKNEKYNKLIHKISELEKYLMDTKELSANKEREYQSILSKNKSLEKDIEELEIMENNFNKFKKHIGSVIKTKDKFFQDELYKKDKYFQDELDKKDKYFQDELAKKDLEIESFKKSIQDFNGLYTFYIQHLQQQIQ